MKTFDWVKRADAAEAERDQWKEASRQQALDWLETNKRAEAAEAALSEMKEALKPFAVIADWFDSFYSPDSDILAYGDGNTHLRVGDFRRARAALASLPREEGHE